MHAVNFWFYYTATLFLESKTHLTEHFEPLLCSSVEPRPLLSGRVANKGGTAMLKLTALAVAATGNRHARARLPIAKTSQRYADKDRRGVQFRC